VTSLTLTTTTTTTKFANVYIYTPRRDCPTYRNGLNLTTIEKKKKKTDDQKKNEKENVLRHGMGKM